MHKLTFKEYMASKDKLRQAIAETPVVSTTYMVKKYCKIRIGESKDNREEIALKPKQRVIVEWRYDDIKNPEPESIILDDISPEEREVYWTGAKLRSWLSKNAVEEIL